MNAKKVAFGAAQISQPVQITSAARRPRNHGMDGYGHSKTLERKRNF